MASSQEAVYLRREMGEDFVIVTPGIRPEWAMVPGDDQQRVMTPAQAIQSGADYVVIGRPILGAKDPVLAAKKVAKEIVEYSGLAEDA